ncbi:OPT oligopeptide transporter [Cytidiella melzeri]|nr:OPT oligopeptide transporter [Cytidiella melzeri]
MSTALPAVSLFRRHLPDVPQDIDDLNEHFNDPNWDYGRNSPTLTAESYDLDHKAKRADSSRHSTSDFDTESNADSSYDKTAVSYDKTELSQSQLWTSGASDYEDDSPYPEVRAAVSNTDDPSMPVNTFRVWLLGITTVFVITMANTLMSLRSWNFTLNTLIIQVAILPFGKLMAYALPTKRFQTLGYEWTLNPGPFNVKEHTLITAMANVTWMTPYVTTVFIVQTTIYGQDLTFAYRILLSLSTQLMALALAGLYRKVVIFPSNMIWPGTLVSCSVMTALHRSWDKNDKNHMTRYKFFLLCALGAGVFYWLPGYLFTGLSVFSWACWIAPTNPAVNAVFGSVTGLGMTMITFDWNSIGLVSNGSPLVSPWWAEVNIYAGFVLLFWIVTPALYFTNTAFAKYMPISAGIPFDNTGLPYDTSLVITNGTFDQDKYEAYSPLFLASSNALSYACCFAILPAAVVHTYVWYGRDIVRSFRRSLADNRDVHSRLMMAYKDVPIWAYGALLAISFVFGAVGVSIFPTGYPVWALIVSIILPMLLLLPISIIRAVTNQELLLNFLAELLGGYIVPGKPVANMLFKTYVSAPPDLAIYCLASMKQGHYMKVAPRVMFAAQFVAIITGLFVSEGVYDVIMKLEDVCTPLNVNGFTCPSASSFSDAATIWGVIGAKRLFGVGQLYNPLMWIILVGALLPIPLYILARRYPYSRWRYVNIPVALSAALFFPPFNGTQFTSWFLVGAVFQFFVRRYHFRWWMRYNYILAAALDAGTSICLVLIVLVTGLANNGNGLALNWWGNTVWQTTNDAIGVPWISLAPNATFGPTTW